MRRAGLATLCLAPLGACAAWQGMMTSGAPVPDCPTVIRASAWVDAMPSVGRSTQRLIVAVKIDDPRPWLLVPVTTDQADLLVLDLSPGGPAVPGNASYREPMTHRRSAVRITCGGKERAHIDQITKVM